MKFTDFQYNCLGLPALWGG